VWHFTLHPTVASRISTAEMHRFRILPHSLVTLSILTIWRCGLNLVHWRHCDDIHVHYMYTDVFIPHTVYAVWIHTQNHNWPNTYITLHIIYNIYIYIIYIYILYICPICFLCHCYIMFHLQNKLKQHSGNDHQLDMVTRLTESKWTAQCDSTAWAHCMNSTP